VQVLATATIKNDEGPEEVRNGEKDIKDAPNLSFSSFISFKDSSLFPISFLSLSLSLSSIVLSILLSSCGPLHFFFAPLDLIADPS